MNDEPRRDERIAEAIEAYRPGRDDPSDPALAPLVERLAADAELALKHQRLQRLDAALGEAIRDVPVPEGLCQRILDRLGLGREDSAAANRARRAKRSRYCPTVG